MMLDVDDGPAAGGHDGGRPPEEFLAAGAVVMRRIPARLAGLVGELLQADPRMRPASAGAVAARLDTLAAG